MADKRPRTLVCYFKHTKHRERIHNLVELVISSNVFQCLHFPAAHSQCTFHPLFFWHLSMTRFFSPPLLSYMLPPILSLTPSFISNSSQVFRFLTLSPHSAKLLCSLPENYFLFHLVPLAFISCGVSSQAAAGAVNWLKATEGTKKIIRLSCNSWNF